MGEAAWCTVALAAKGTPWALPYPAPTVKAVGLLLCLTRRWGPGPRLQEVRLQERPGEQPSGHSRRRHTGLISCVAGQALLQGSLLALCLGAVGVEV